MNRRSLFRTLIAAPLAAVVPWLRTEEPTVMTLRLDREHIQRAINDAMSDALKRLPHRQ